MIFPFQGLTFYLVFAPHFSPLVGIPMSRKAMWVPVLHDFTLRLMLITHCGMIVSDWGHLDDGAHGETDDDSASLMMCICYLFNEDLSTVGVYIAVKPKCDLA